MKSRRRGQNEGSVFERKDGRWCGVLNLGWENGRRVRKYIYGETAQEVQDALLKARFDLAAGLPVKVERQTVAQFLQGWLENSVKPASGRLRMNSIGSTSSSTSRRCSATTGSPSSPQHVRTFINQKLADGLSPRTVHLSLVILRQALGQAVKDGLVGRNIAKLVDTPRWKRPEVKPWGRAEAGRFIDAIKSCVRQVQQKGPGMWASGEAAGAERSPWVRAQRSARSEFKQLAA